MTETTCMKLTSYGATIETKSQPKPTPPSTTQYQFMDLQKLS